MFTVDGTATGLEGTGLVLRNSLIDDITPVDGQFAFERGLLAGAGYHVEIGSRPAHPVQECTVVAGVVTAAAGPSRRIRGPPL